MAADLLSIDAQLCFALHDATRAVVAAYQPALAPLGLTYPQYLVLLVLWEKDGLAVKDVGARLHLDSGTLTPLLKRMEGNGLVTRRRSAEDERVVEVHLTPAGKRLRRRAASIPGALACKVKLPPRELARLRDEIQSLTRTLRNATESPRIEP